MDTISLTAELRVTLCDDSLSIDGDLNRRNAPLMLQWLEEQPPIPTLELEGLDIEDGVAATLAVNAVRLLGSRVPLLRIIHAPQLLAHNLYRVGLLLQGGIVLVAVREEEPYG